MIAIIDYGVGNLFSLYSSLRYLGIDSVITSDKSLINTADQIILPGVGAFADAMKKLKECNGYDVLLQNIADGKPLLGICLGMQMLFNKSEEYGSHEGLKLIDGKVVPLRGYIPDGEKVPQIGWNGLQLTRQCPLFKYIKDGDCVYFVHSYYAETDDTFKIANTDYFKPVTAAVNKNNVYGTQFHPEKSGEVGLRILKAFSEIR